MTKKANVNEIFQTAYDLAQTLLKKKVEGVAGIAKDGDMWKVLVEVVERKAIPDTQDILGIYEFTFADDGELAGFKRVELRHRSNMGTMTEEPF